MAYTYNSKFPTYIKPEALTDQQIHRLTESKSFCMMPWTHMHAFPDGRAFPCCLSVDKYPIGDLHKNTMAEVWNDQPLRDMRVKMNVPNAMSRKIRAFSVCVTAATRHLDIMSV